MKAKAKSIKTEKNITSRNVLEKDLFSPSHNGVSNLQQADGTGHCVGNRSKDIIDEYAKHCKKMEEYKRNSCER